MAPPAVPPAALLLIAGPSCAGKDTLLRALLDARPELRKPVTTTTRPPRTVADGFATDEVNGVHYHFVTPETFLAERARGAFIETNQYGAHYYGLTHAALADVRRAGGIPVAILDVNGVRAVTAQLPTVTVFIAAPIEEIEARLRAMRPADQLPDRLALARRELAEAPFFDHVVVNRNGALERAVADLLTFYDTVARPRLIVGLPTAGAMRVVRTRTP